MTPLLYVYKLSKYSARIEKADPTLNNQVPLIARLYCGPFMHANGAGFYIYLNVDLDISYNPIRIPRWIWNIEGNFYDNDDLVIMEHMKIKDEQYKKLISKPRTKIHFSGLNDEPKHTVQLWTGCVFKTPPGWALWIRDPVNREKNRPFRVQEAILETSWLHNDIWLNLEFVRWSELAKLRSNGPPIAQIIPVQYTTYENWQKEEDIFNPDNSTSQQVFDQWIEYNWDKYYSNPKKIKEQGTYHKWRSIFHSQS